MEPVGVYIHVPFCERVCPYCDFAVVAARPLRPRDEDRYVTALVSELERRAPDYAGRSLASVYFGGGTPSLLQPDSVARVVQAVRSIFPAAAAAEAEVGCEITLEVNPSTLERQRLPSFRSAGVNRLSIGVQSFDDVVLRRLGRAHRARDARETLAAARVAGFDNISLDLILLAPGGSARQLERDLDELIAFGPEHVSTYELTVEAGTPFALADARGQLERPGEEAAIASLEAVEARLGAAGIERYEISSHARSGFESRHNRRYWRREPVLGIGMSAWSSLPPSTRSPQGGRLANQRLLEAYLAAIEAGESAVSHEERHDAQTARSEAVFLGLREVLGVRAASFEREFGGPPRAFFSAAIDALVEQGLLDEALEGDLRLTRRGLLLADSVAARFV